MDNGDGRAAKALLGLTGALFALDAFSSLHSSPYTAEVRGGDEDNAKRVRYYMVLSAVAAVVIAGGWAIYAGHPEPLIGAVIIVFMMIWLYTHALRRGQDNQEE